MSAELPEQGTVRYIRCASCGGMNPASAATCARCGAVQSSATPVPPSASSPNLNRPQVTCPNCQKTFPAGSKFCGYCGTHLPAAPPPAPAPPPPIPQPVNLSDAPPLPRSVAPPPPPAPPIPRPTPPVPQPSVAPPPVPRPVAPPSPRPVTPPAPPFPGPSAPPLRPSAPENAPDGTVVFSGMRTVPRVEAKVSEKKPDGSWGRTIPIAKETFIGREGCDLSYPHDMLLSPRHASVGIHDGKLVLKDLKSQNGSFIRQRQDTELKAGDIFLLGRELFRFVTQNLEDSANKGSAEGTMVWSVPKLQKAPVSAKLEHIKLNGEVVAEFKLDKPEVSLGRTTGDLVFKDDPYMSGTHARIVAMPGRFLLQDLRSRNGVYRRVREEIALVDGDEFFMGEQLFHVGLKSL